MRKLILLFGFLFLAPIARSQVDVVLTTGTQTINGAKTMGTGSTLTISTGSKVNAFGSANWVIWIASADASGVSKTTFTLTGVGYLNPNEVNASSIAWELKGECSNLSQTAIPSLVFNGDYACTKNNDTVALNGAGLGVGNVSGAVACTWQPFNNAGIASGITTNFSFDVVFRTCQNNGTQICGETLRPSIEALDANGRLTVDISGYRSNSMTNPPQTIMITTSGSAATSVPTFNATYNCHFDLFRLGMQSQ